MASEVEAIQQRMLERAARRLLKSGDWKTAEEVAHLGNRSLSNARSLARSWMRRSLIFSIQYEEQHLYPAYGLDAASGFRPKANLRKIIEAFPRGVRSGWRLAFWFDSPNSYLAGRSPKDCLDGPMDIVLHAARAEAEGVWHG